MYDANVRSCVEACGRGRGTLLLLKRGRFFLMSFYVGSACLKVSAKTSSNQFELENVAFLATKSGRHVYVHEPEMNALQVSLTIHCLEGEGRRGRGRHGRGFE